MNRDNTREPELAASWLELMNDEIKLPGYEVSDHTDATGNILITDFNRVVSRTVANNRHEQRRQKIRAALVREYFDQEHEASPSLPIRLLKLFKLN